MRIRILVAAQIRSCGFGLLRKFVVNNNVVNLHELPKASNCISNKLYHYSFAGFFFFLLLTLNITTMSVFGIVLFLLIAGMAFWMLLFLLGFIVPFWITMGIFEKMRPKRILEDKEAH